MAQKKIPKKVIIVHCWGAKPKDNWYFWLKEELTKKKISVEVLAMPDSDYPKIIKWVSHLSESAGSLDENTFLVGHSIGCQTIMRYLEKTHKNKKIGGAVFVAGWLNLNNLETNEEQKIAEPWLKKPIDFERIKKHTDKFVAIFSDNDPYVPTIDQNIFRKRLGAKIVIEKNKGHFTKEDGSKKLEVALKELLAIMK